jgi:hypothetical protein
VRACVIAIVVLVLLGVGMIFVDVLRFSFGAPLYAGFALLSLALVLGCVVIVVSVVRMRGMDEQHHSKMKQMEREMKGHGP